MLNDTEVVNKSYVKYLGCILDNNLSCTSMAYAVIKKTNGHLKFLYRNIKFLDQRTRKLLSNALIQSHHDYASTSWFSGLNQDLKKKLQIIQNKTLRFILDLGPRDHIGKIELDKVGYINIESRVKLLQLSHVHKIFHNKSVPYMAAHFERINSFHNYHTRNSQLNFRVPSAIGKCNTTFYYRGIKAWNDLPNDIKCVGNNNIFKLAVKKHLSSLIQL